MADAILEGRASVATGEAEEEFIEAVAEETPTEVETVAVEAEAEATTEKAAE